MQQHNTGVVFRQRVNDGKVGFARRLRREMTPAERLMWEQLRDRRLAGLKFRRQQIIEGFIVDFYCDSARLVVEIDGGQHSEPQQHEDDERRARVFARRDSMRFASRTHR